MNGHPSFPAPPPTRGETSTTRTPPMGNNFSIKPLSTYPTFTANEALERYNERVYCKRSSKILKKFIELRNLEQRSGGRTNLSTPLGGVLDVRRPRKAGRDLLVVGPTEADDELRTRGDLEGRPRLLVVDPHLHVRDLHQEASDVDLPIDGLHDPRRDHRLVGLREVVATDGLDGGHTEIRHLGEILLAIHLERNDTNRDRKKCHQQAPHGILRIQ